jgi:hypothetical protein
MQGGNIKGGFHLLNTSSRNDILCIDTHADFVWVVDGLMKLRPLHNCEESN